MQNVSKALEFILEENRRKTFKKWVFGDKDACNADKMAEAGFIFIGSKVEPDAVKCFFCNKSLEGWEATDDPWLEHLKHSPKCHFVKLQKPQEDLTLKQFLDLVDAFTEKEVESYFNKKSDEIKEKAKEYREKLISMLEKH